jgi:hypothetical protein
MLQPAFKVIQIERLFAIVIAGKFTRDLWPMDGYVSTGGSRQEAICNGKIYPGETDDREDEDLAESNIDEYADERRLWLLEDDKACDFLRGSMRIDSELPVALYLTLL